MDVDDAGIGFIVILPGKNDEVMKRIFDQDIDDFIFKLLERSL